MLRCGLVLFYDEVGRMAVSIRHRAFEDGLDFTCQGCSKFKDLDGHVEQPNILQVNLGVDEEVGRRL
jgi:hypothetical protein